MKIKNPNIQSLNSIQNNPPNTNMQYSNQPMQTNNQKPTYQPNGFTHVSENSTPVNMQYPQQNQQNMQNTPVQPQNSRGKSGKKKSTILIVVLILILAIIGVLVAVKFLKQKEPEKVVVEETYETTNRFILDNLQKAINDYNAEELDKLIGSNTGDSWLAKEWAYVNHVPIREEFIKKIGSLVKFTYPSVQRLNTDGTVAIKEDGTPFTTLSTMDTNEPFKITVPDYKSIKIDKDYITKLYNSAGYSSKDYEYDDKMINLFIQYILDTNTDFPVKTVEVTLPIANKVIEDDAALDDMLFGNEELYDLSKQFSQTCFGWTGTKDEEYTEKKEVHNDEYDEWYKIFKKRYDADKGYFKPGVSGWEPWYLYDDKNRAILDKDGKLQVKYYSVKDENGQDWIQPAKTIIKKIKKTRQIPDPWEEERGVKYNWIGVNYLTNIYKGNSSTVTRVGNGSFEYPAGIGTPVITQALGVDGKHHDVRVTLLGYWTDQNAIDYAEKFSPKNRGFTVDSVVKLITFEVKVENLEGKPVEYVGSEMALVDRNTNVSPKTGTMYSFSEGFTLKPKEEIIINDWYSSTELPQKYAVWGKTFGREYSMKFFDCLAGTGVIPPYSAYKEFSGKSNIDESINTGENNTTRPTNETATDSAIETEPKEE